VKFVEFSSSRDVFYQTHPQGVVRNTSATGQKLIRKAIRNYVYNMNRIDHINDVDRLDIAFNMSGQGVKHIIKETYDAIQGNLKGLERDVTIVSDSTIEANQLDGRHQVEYITHSYKEGQKRSESYIATLKYEIRPTKVSVDDELKNPLDIYITAYSVSKRSNSEEN
jgi:type IV secretory pathway component VirB8